MAEVLPDLTLHIEQTIEINASEEAVFESLLSQLGSKFGTPTGQPMPMKLELWPGGRWYRDLGDNNGHLWGHVQVVKRPLLIELAGPMFMSYAAVSHIQFRVTRENSKTILGFRHQALGMIQDDHREGVRHGWTHMLCAVQQDAEQL